MEVRNGGKVVVAVRTNLEVVKRERKSEEKECDYIYEFVAWVGQRWWWMENWSFQAKLL